MKVLLRIGIVVVALFFILGVVLIATTHRFGVEGDAMEPNFHAGQLLIVDSTVYQTSSPQRGDVIVFHYPDNPADTYIKRVIGLPGETLEIKGGQVIINDQPIDEPYLPIQAPEAQRGKWTVTQGSYFVMGDNRGHSSDSRSWGLLARRFIIGKVWMTYWPLGEWGTVPQVTYDGLSS
jgi:signal peptidase I